LPFAFLASVVRGAEAEGPAGDEAEIHVAGERTLNIARDRRRERALERLRAFKWTLPADWKFDREEANRR
jgi:antitoxin MazE